MRCIAAIVVFTFAAAAYAQNPAAAVTCSPKTGTLVIRYTPEVDEAKWPDSWDVVDFYGLLDLDREKTRVEGARSKTIRCRLKKDLFDVKLEPGVTNPNLLGRCGADFTGIVTVKRNGKEIFSEPFEKLNCDERERMLAKIVLRDGSPKPRLTYVRTDDR